MVSRNVLSLPACLAVLLGVTATAGPAAGLPPTPVLSTLVPVEDLVGQVEYYLEELEECVESRADYEDSVDKLKRCSHTLAVISLSIGMHDKPSNLQEAAPALMKASRDLAQTRSFAEAMAGLDRVKAAASTSGDPAGLKWAKVADLHPLMEQVPLVNMRLRKHLRKFDNYQDRLAGDSAALLAIAQGSMPNADETEAPGEVTQWYKYSLQMRDAAVMLNKAVHAGNEEGAGAAMAVLQKSCDDCHAVFYKDQ